MITLITVLKDESKDAGVPFVMVMMFSWYFPVWQEDDEAGEEEKWVCCWYWEAASEEKRGYRCLHPKHKKHQHSYNQQPVLTRVIVTKQISDCIITLIISKSILSNMKRIDLQIPSSALAESAKIWADTCQTHEAYQFLRWFQWY